MRCFRPHGRTLSKSGLIAHKIQHDLYNTPFRLAAQEPAQNLPANKSPPFDIHPVSIWQDFWRQQRATGLKNPQLSKN
jgi:hypothetical protein